MLSDNRRTRPAYGQEENVKADHVPRAVTLLRAIAVASAALAGLPVMSQAETVVIDDIVQSRSEIDRMRYFREIDVIGAVTQAGLTGAGVRVTIMGEVVDPDHPDLAGRVIGQYETVTQPGKILSGKGPYAVHADKLGLGDGHGTHIAGTIAAVADGRGIVGISPAATLDVYDIGIYGAAHVDLTPADFLSGFATAMRDVTARGESRIVTGSFNLEAPAIAGLAPNSTTFEEIEESISFLSIKRTLSRAPFDLLSKPDRARLFELIRAFDRDQSIAAMAMVPATPEWSLVAEAIAAYQANDGVYIVTESNYDFGSDTSTLNAMPSLDPRVDPEMWISTVMTTPERFETADSQAEVEAAITEGPYVTPLNGCGTMAREYCLSVPSYSVLSAMTAEVAETDSPLLKFDGRTFQSFDGHSMGAPMIAAALALLEEYNRASGLGLSMRELVRVLKDSADKDIPGYDPVRHGLGMLDVDAALAELIAR